MSTMSSIDALFPPLTLTQKQRELLLKIECCCYNDDDDKLKELINQWWEEVDNDLRLQSQIRRAEHMAREIMFRKTLQQMNKDQIEISISKEEFDQALKGDDQ